MMAALFVPGTPAEVQELIHKLLAINDLSIELRAAVERLAGNEAMEPFWRQ